MALGAAVAWGLGYTLDERLMKSGLTPAVLMIAHMAVTFPLYLYYALSHGDPMKELGVILSDKKIIIILIISSIAILGGNFLILYSIHEKNATLASMIEISYPFFIAFFSWLFFKDLQFNAWTMLGGILVFCGIGVILLKS